MEFTDVLTAISTVGFPCVACYFMFDLCKGTIKENTTAITSLQETIVDMKATVETLSKEREES